MLQYIMTLHCSCTLGMPGRCYSRLQHCWSPCQRWHDQPRSQSEGSCSIVSTCTKMRCSIGSTPSATAARAVAGRCRLTKMARRCWPRPATWPRWTATCALLAACAPTIASSRRFPWMTDSPTSMLLLAWAVACASPNVHRKLSPCCATRPRASRWRSRSSLLMLRGWDKLSRCEQVIPELDGIPSVSGQARPCSSRLVERCSFKGCLLGIDRKGLVLHNMGVVGSAPQTRSAQAGFICQSRNSA
jgi:hypothetical protein